MTRRTPAWEKARRMRTAHRVTTHPRPTGAKGSPTRAGQAFFRGDLDWLDYHAVLDPEGAARRRSARPYMGA